MPKPGEPYWLPSDVDAAIAWQTEQDLTCPNCGNPRDETMAREATFGYEAVPVRCHSCAAIDRASKQFTAKPHDPAGLRWQVRPLDAQPSTDGE